jgi:hypothetical protein
MRKRVKISAVQQRHNDLVAQINDNYLEIKNHLSSMEAEVLLNFQGENIRYRIECLEKEICGLKEMIKQLIVPQPMPPYPCVPVPYLQPPFYPYLNQQR